MTIIKRINQELSEKEFVEYINTLNTPAYIYNLDLLKIILDSINEKIRSHKYIKLFYAVKANSNEEILKFIKPSIDGVDVASIEEYRIVKEIYENKEISITGPSFTRNDIKTFYEDGRIFDFNSLSQLESCLEYISNKAIGIRVNIPYSQKNSEKESRFGIPLFKSRIFEIIKDNNISLVRIHIHNGDKSPFFFDHLRRQLNYLKAANLLKDIKEINLGGGLLKSIMQDELPLFIKKNN